MIHWLFNLNVFGVNYDFLHDFLDLDYFWNLLLNGNQHLPFGWDLDYLLFNGWHFDELLDDVIDYFNNFNRLVNYLLNFNVFWHLDNLFNIFLNWHNLWHFNDSLNYFFNNSLNLNDSLFNSKDFQDVVNVHNVQDFLVDQSNNSLVNFQNSSVFGLQLLNLFKKSFNQNSQVEFNLLGS